MYQKLEALRYLKSRQKTKDQSIFLSPDFNFLIFKAKDEHDEPPPDLPFHFSHFLSLYDRVKHKAPPVRLYLTKPAWVEILSTEGGATKEYFLYLGEGNKHLIDNRAIQPISYEILNQLKNLPFEKASFSPPNQPNVYVYTHLWTVEWFDQTLMTLTFQEGFVHQHLVLQFDWMEGQVLIPSVNSVCFGYRFYIDDPLILKAFETLWEISQTSGFTPEIFKNL
ncbi:MAG: hypothetical protein XD42_1121 [Thermodesulfobacterium sp. 37_54]|uniref:Uncharacterized protein n=1 Tax=Thermodesulfobacterium commune TaxID=1741 RepID=A0A101FKI1_9BACT|nr:MAG: hypothetical protein XD42_1121 [Thermodesulfobacterium sp. 37_54]KUK18826.1 MAG: hypothetical protein XD55_1114 [Thermodesulfobacterium commune]KUK38699.1 MAG: hypothetical protein XD67_0067 [Thermodesulfobacterium commune]HAA84383.1 hypothetical protein [Thermodesulfobacterium commune]HBT04694.1 hypothetical protein [Thermodesulfobacterium commune]